ncbi:Uncharacterised protein [Enterobacter hormaechei]|nr:Uncharacterised protein [Enterobacter hormaechei]VAK94469.1 Uncharacterised protein [Enterobacter hormaechei]
MCICIALLYKVELLLTHEVLLAFQCPVSVAIWPHGLHTDALVLQGVHFLLVGIETPAVFAAGLLLRIEAHPLLIIAAQTVLTAPGHFDQRHAHHIESRQGAACVVLKLVVELRHVIADLAPFGLRRAMHGGNLSEHVFQLLRVTFNKGIGKALAFASIKAPALEVFIAHSLQPFPALDLSQCGVAGRVYAAGVKFQAAEAIRNAAHVCATHLVERQRIVDTDAKVARERYD